MTGYTNLHGIDLSLAVWLLHDDYDFVPKERAISMTSLLKPTRQIILGLRVTPDMVGPVDITDNISRRLGHAIHDSIEHSWKKGYRRAMQLMNIPDKVIDRIVINPEPEDLKSDSIPVYIEQRGYRTLNGWTISGKMDMCLDGRLKDTKSTSVYAYILGSKDDDYIRQGSGYRWLHPDKVTADEMDIQFVFTDWQSSMARQQADYPETRIKNYSLPLMGEKEMENWIAQKLRDIEKYIDAPDVAIPRCTDEELWKSADKWKYYSNPKNTSGRATKNFDDEAQANAHLAEKGKGCVVHVPGEVKACGYCPAFAVCEQRKEYFPDAP